MIEIENDRLVFHFPDVHRSAKLRVDFQRTLRIPDDGKDYPLPPGFGSFPLHHIDDFGDNVPQAWKDRGGIMLPMYQSEALWLNFSSDHVTNQGAYPFLLKIAAGKVNAVTGEAWNPNLGSRIQDYVVVPTQPWLDGYRTDDDVVRQFVAMPLGDGYSVEEQLTGAAEFGGIQLMAYPMKRESFERLFPVMPYAHSDGGGGWLGGDDCWGDDEQFFDDAPRGAAMGLGAGGRMKQEITNDPYSKNDWNMDVSSRCFVHLTNSLVWRSITGLDAPSTPVTAREYKSYGYPWYKYYSDGPSVKGSTILQKVKSVFQLGKEKGTNPLPENQSVEPTNVIKIKANEVRDGEW